MPSYSDFDDKELKHMEMIQAVVARLAGNSSLVKGWAITLTGAFLGFAVNNNDAGLAAAAFLPIGAFCLLDAYYLWLERKFRDLFNRVRKRSGGIEPFFMGATSPDLIGGRRARVSSYLKTLRRPAVAGFYGLLALATVAVIMVLAPW